MTAKNHTSQPLRKGDETPRHPMTILSAFAEKPADVRFETQESEETVELFLRQHWIVNLPWLLLVVVMAFIPTVATPLLIRMNLPVAIPAGYFLVAGAFWYLATFGIALASFIHWYFNIYIVTNERIVDIDFMYLLYKKFSVADLNKIQDISYTEKGIFSTIFDFGNVFVQTASEMPTIEFDSVPHPERVVEKIRELTERMEGSS